jgi:hypothetical protein
VRHHSNELFERGSLGPMQLLAQLVDEQEAPRESLVDELGQSAAEPSRACFGDEA